MVSVRQAEGLGRRSRVPIPSQPFSLRGVGNLDHRYSGVGVAIPVGPSGGEVEQPDCRDPVAGQQSASGLLGKVVSVHSAKRNTEQRRRRLMAAVLAPCGCCVGGAVA
jgi:hypothetical protein